MARVKPVFRPSDFPGELDEEMAGALSQLFEFVGAGKADAELGGDDAGLAIAAQNPGLALRMAHLTRYAALQTGWAQRPDLLELAVQAVYFHFRCSHGFEARLGRAQSTGLGLERLAAIPYWRTSSLFDAEQTLILEYVEAVVAGEVAETLFEPIRETYGERGAIELTVMVGCFAMWAMLINATLR